MAFSYDTNVLRQIEANDSEFNKAQKADNLRNIQTNIALNGIPAQQSVQQPAVVPQVNAPAVNAGTEIQGQQTAPVSTNDPAWYLKATNMPTTATQAVAQGMAPSFNAQAVTNAAIANLMKKGYSHDEATQMLSPYIMDWQSREARENKAKADDLMTQIGNMDYGSKDYYNAALRLAQLDPERGQMLLRGAVTPKEMWMRENRLADLADQRAYQEQMRAMYGGGRGAGRPRGSGGGSGGGGGRRGRTASDSNLNALLKRQKYLRAEMAGIEKLGESASPQDRERHRRLYDALRATNSQLDGYYIGYPGGSGDGEAPGILGTTKEQLANGVKNVIWDDGLKAGGPSEDAIEYLMSKLPKGATPEKIRTASDALYNAAGAAEDADAALLGDDASLAVRQQQYSDGMREADRLGYKVDLDGTIYGASEEFKNKYPNLKYGGGADYYKGLLAQYVDDEEENV